MFKFKFMNNAGASRFRRNFIKVVRANLLAQALPLFVSPLLTRIYAPSDFGAVVLFSSVLSILLAFASWRFEWSIPNASSRTQAAALLFLGASSLIVTSILSILIFWFARAHLSIWNGAEVLGPFILLVPLAVVGGGLHQLLQFWYVREADLTAVSRARIAQSISNTSLCIGGGFASLGAIGLIGSTIVSAWAGIGMLYKYHSSQLTKAVGRLTTKRLKLCGWRFGTESTLSAITSVINASSLAMLPLLLAQYYPVTEVGWFALAQRIAISPVCVVTGAVGQSFWAEAASLIREDRSALRRLYLKSTRRLGFLSLPVALVCLAGPLYVGLVFGEAKWEGAGWLLAALVPMLLGQIIFAPLHHLSVHRRQGWSLLWDISRFALLVLTIRLTASHGAGIVFTVTSVSFTYLVMYLVLFGLNILALNSQVSVGLKKEFSCAMDK